MAIHANATIRNNQGRGGSSSGGGATVATETITAVIRQNTGGTATKNDEARSWQIREMMEYLSSPMGPLLALTPIDNPATTGVLYISNKCG